MSEEYMDICEKLSRENETLRAQVAALEARLREAGEQKPVAYSYRKRGSLRPYWLYADELPTNDDVIDWRELYAAAPVPAQPAVPEAVAKDAARYRWIRSDMKMMWGDDVLAIIGESGASFDAAIDAAILSATDTEVK
jgi:hypothetical protein